MVKRYLFSVVKTIVVVVMGLMVFVASGEEDKTYLEIEWIALTPEDDLSVLLNPPDFLSDIIDGSPRDSLDMLREEWSLDEDVQRFKQAMTSTRVIKEYDNKAIRIPGFIVPLESNEEQKATTFFVVPYFGACIHMPPPPPNQIIYVASSTGVEVEDLYQPFWFEGVLTIETNANALGASAYRLKLDRVILYEEE